MTHLENLGSESSNNQINPKFEEFSKVLQWYIFNNQDKASSETAILSESDAADHGLIIGINAKWGAGKSTFLNYFCNTVKKQSNKILNHTFDKASDPSNQKNIMSARIKDDIGKPCIVIRYNAWAQDYVDEPFLSLIGQIYSQIKDLDPKKLNVAIKNVLQFLVKTSSAFSCHGANFDLEKIGEAAQEAFSNEIDIFLKEQKAFGENLQSFKEMIETIGSNETLKIIVIDELDRCMPVFAVKLLERLKHFFNIKNVVIIAAYDRTNLTSTIRKVYGEIDGDHYLSRFFNLELNLPELPPEHLISRYYDANAREYALLEELFLLYNVSAREMIKILSLLDTVKESHEWTRPEMVILFVLKLSQPKIFARLISTKFTFKDKKGFYELLKKFQDILSYDDKLSFRPEPNDPNLATRKIVINHGEAEYERRYLYQTLYEFLLYFIIRDNGYEASSQALWVGSTITGELLENDLFKTTAKNVFSRQGSDAAHFKEHMNVMVNFAQCLLTD